MTAIDPAPITPPIINGWQALVILMPGVLAFLTSTVAVVIGYLARQDVKELHMIVNSRLEQLLVSTGAQRYAEGQVEGKAAGRASLKSDQEWARIEAHKDLPGPMTGQDANTEALRANTMATDANTAEGAKGKP